MKRNTHLGPSRSWFGRILVALASFAFLMAVLGCAGDPASADDATEAAEPLPEVRRRADEPTPSVDVAEPARDERITGIRLTDPLPTPDYPEGRSNYFGIHLLIHPGDDVAEQIGWAHHLVGDRGFVKQLTDPITLDDVEPADHVFSFLAACYERSLVPVLRVTMPFCEDGYWTKPPTDDGEDPESPGDYSLIADAVARYFAALPISPDLPLYVEVLNEVNLRFEWNNELPNPIHYGYFLIAVSDALKGIEDADIRIVNAGLSPGSPGGSVSVYNYIRVLGDRVPEVFDTIDYWGTHSYPGNVSPDYNYHNGELDPATRSWGIDAYVLELRQISTYTDRTFEVIITETGYDVGNRVNPGFATVTEELRARYTEEAFAHYWSQWPEVHAVIPFILADTATDRWDRYAWVYPDSGSHDDGYPTATRPLYDRVAALPKP